MTDWTSGYVADIGYTFGYYAELNPARVRQAFLNAGLVPPEAGTACELGFGQGLSTAMHAAASPTTWYGTDFNPAQAGFAQQLAAVSETGATLSDQAFGEFCARTDLPDFDFIGLHGIWSWISDENRRIIVDFVRRKLKVGGVLYVSYNTEAGWSSMVPMRRLMAKHSAVMSAQGMKTVDKVSAAIAFADKLLATDTLFGKTNPMLLERMKVIKEQDRHYVAHEYFNQDWHPMAFSTMAEWLAPAKLEFACSAHLLDHLAAINLTPEQQALLAEIPDQVLRESVRDVMVNQPFRRDYWVRGARRMSRMEQIEASRKLRVVLLNVAKEITLKTRGSLGEADMSAEIYQPLIEALSDYKPRSVAQLEQLFEGTAVTFRQLTQALLVLAGKGNLGLAQDDKVIAKARAHTDKLNSYLVTKARDNSDIAFLASPVTGAGVPISRFVQLFILGRAQGIKTASELAAMVWGYLRLEGKSLVKSGTTLVSEEDNLEELKSQAEHFLETRVPLLKGLGIIG